MKDESEAEDSAQEALIRAWKHQDRLRDPDRWAEWIRQISRNEALRGLGRKHPTPTEELEDRGEQDHRLEDLIEGGELAAALASLDDRDREILTLRYIEDLTQPAVAERLGIPEGTAKVRLNRARKRLATKLRQ